MSQANSNTGRPGRMQPFFMHPAIYITGFAVVGELFALQSWVNFRHWGYHVRTGILFGAWGTQFFVWGILCWLMWRFWPQLVSRKSRLQMLIRIVPLSLVFPVIEEMVWVFFFPTVPLDMPHMAYWKRFAFQFQAEFIDSMIIFWCAFFLFRGIDYYQRFREKENAAAQLEAQLANAKLAALRMQLNPHFLFNAMNSISSLMRTDVNAADTMLEQLSSLLRISLERGSVQLIPLHEEMEFIEVYLSMQDQRYAGRVKREVDIDSELHDALVPAMFLQPVVENAYAHGLSRIADDGELMIEGHRAAGMVNFSVVNSGLGLELPTASSRNGNGHGLGLANIRSRLRLHYGENCSIEMSQTDRTHVKVTIAFPFQRSKEPEGIVAQYGAE
jgi:two-component system, LytTR family, sensor kinase